MRLKNVLESVRPGRLQLWLGAFFFATVLWLFVLSEQTFVHVLGIPLEVRNIRAGKALGAEVAPSAEVRFRGTGRAFFKTYLLRSFSEFKLVLDLEQISTEYDFYLNDYFHKHEEKVVMPASFELQFVDVVRPDSIHISLDDYIIKDVAVVVDHEVAASAGYTVVGPVRYAPATVELRGPKELLRAVDTVRTAPVRLSGLVAAVIQTVPLQLDFPRVVEASHRSVELTADVQSIGQTIVGEVPVRVVNAPEEYRVFVSPSSVSLTVVGGVRFLAGLEPDDISATVDFATQWNPQDPHVQPRIAVPAGVIEWKDLSPRTVELIATRTRK